MSSGSDQSPLITYRPLDEPVEEAVEQACEQPSDEPSDASPGEQSRDFDGFYMAHHDEVGRALAFTLGDKTLAKEAVDEAMARAYQRWSSVGQFENPAGWVYRTGLNWAKSRRRSAFRRKRREEKVAVGTSAVLDDPTGAAHDLLKALATLSSNHRSVVVLRHYCDWSVAATAEALDISEGTVKSRNARALEQLRVVLEDPEGVK